MAHFEPFIKFWDIKKKKLMLKGAGLCLGKMQFGHKEAELGCARRHLYLKYGCQNMIL